VRWMDGWMDWVDGLGGWIECARAADVIDLLYGKQIPNNGTRGVGEESWAWHGDID
jgi:hypothetical protein